MCLDVLPGFLTPFRVPSPPQSLPPNFPPRKLLYLAKPMAKKNFVPRLPFAGGADQRFRMIDIALECLASRRCQSIFGFGRASVEGLFANDVVRFFQRSRVDAQVAVRRSQQRL